MTKYFLHMLFHRIYIQYPIYINIIFLVFLKRLHLKKTVEQIPLIVCTLKMLGV